MRVSNADITFRLIYSIRYRQNCQNDNFFSFNLTIRELTTPLSLHQDKLSL
ncbi:hypothetical protein J14TS2_31420 [Bacillus sp. J14TS2]|nr:hypothetical protein J14TS2_31420 [Bacillus sp. J14TS2]